MRHGVRPRPRVYHVRWMLRGMKARLHMGRRVEVVHAARVHSTSAEVHTGASSAEAASSLCRLRDDDRGGKKGG